MSSLNKAENPEHRKLVKGLIDCLDKEGFKPFCAACKGFNQCSPNGSGPDGFHTQKGSEPFSHSNFQPEFADCYATIVSEQ